MCVFKRHCELLICKLLFFYGYFVQYEMIHINLKKCINRIVQDIFTTLGVFRVNLSRDGSSVYE